VKKDGRAYRIGKRDFETDYHVDEDGGLSVDGKPVTFVHRGTMALLIKFVAMGCVFLDCNTESLMLKGATKILTNSIYTNGRYLLYCEDFRAAVNAKLNDENFGRRVTQG